MVSGNRGNYILELTKRPSPSEKGVSLCRKEPLFTSKRRPLHLQTIVFTPLSIRRGDGGEAVDGRELGWLWLGVRLVMVRGEASLLPFLSIKFAGVKY